MKEITKGDFTGKTASEKLKIVNTKANSLEEMRIGLEVLVRRKSAPDKDLLSEFFDKVCTLAADGSIIKPSTFEPDDNNGRSIHWPPTIVYPTDKKGNRLSKDVIFNEYSALWLCGYRVGKKGLSSDKRKELLISFMERQLHPAIKEIFVDEYGEPYSPEENPPKRLMKVANVIAANCRNMKRNQIKTGHDYSTAIAHYEEDLEFLREHYFEQWKIGNPPLPWPKTETR